MMWCSCGVCWGRESAIDDESGCSLLARVVTGEGEVAGDSRSPSSVSFSVRKLKVSMDFGVWHADTGRCGRLPVCTCTRP